MRIVALDPGQSTGCAIRFENGDLVVTTIKDRLQVWQLIERLRPDVIIVENFSTAGHISTDGLHTVRMVGAVEALAWAYKAKFVKQEPTYRTSMLPPAENHIPRGQEHKFRHEKDAVAHLLAHERDEGKKVLRKDVPFEQRAKRFFFLEEIYEEYCQTAVVPNQIQTQTGPNDIQIG